MSYSNIKVGDIIKITYTKGSVSHINREINCYAVCKEKQPLLIRTLIIYDEDISSTKFSHGHEITLYKNDIIPATKLSLEEMIQAIGEERWLKLMAELL